MKSIIIIVFALVGNLCLSQTVQIPDKNFEQALIDLEIDSDKSINGQILKSDAVLISFLDVSNKNIKDLSGIEAFTSLVYLHCSDNELSEIDLRQNIALINILNNVNDVKTSYPNVAYTSWFDYY
jgi:Leucine-rich repeat (LRR) protein